MAVQIPWQVGADFTFEIALDRYVYLVRLRWNPVASLWFMDLMTRSKTEVIMGMCLVRGADLLNQAVGAFAPRGALLITGNSEPSYESFLAGTTQLIYLTAAEVNAI